MTKKRQTQQERVAYLESLYKKSQDRETKRRRAIQQAYDSATKKYQDAQKKVSDREADYRIKLYGRVELAKRRKK